jgi:hypothetical protein
MSHGTLGRGLTRRTVILGVPAVAMARLAGAAGQSSGATAASRPASGPATNSPNAAGSGSGRPNVAEIRTHADALLPRAVRSTYGWGWADGEPGVDLTRVRDPRLRSRQVDALLTARAGLLLDMAGRLAGHPPYRAAAVEAARGLSALQTRAGQIRGRGVMGLMLPARDDAAGDQPDRGPTCATVALIVHLLDGWTGPDGLAAAGRGVAPDGPVAPPEGQPAADPRLRGPVQRAAHWLASQQTRAGGWPSIYPPDAPKGQGTKLLRLDAADFRDAALAVLLVADRLDDRQLDQHVDRAADQLVALRLVAGRPPRRALWASAYRPDGDANLRLAELPLAVDLLATRHAAEVLLARYLLALDSRLDPPLTDLREALAGLPRLPAGDWHRRYEPNGLRPFVGPSPAAATQPASVFDFARPATNPATAVALAAPCRTAELLARLDRIRVVGPKSTRDELATTLPLRQRIVLAVAGLVDDAIVMDGPPWNSATVPEARGELAERLHALWQAVSPGI